MRTGTEFLKLTRDELLEIVKGIAEQKIIGPFFIGKIGPKQVRWLDDGSVEVITEYVRGDWTDLEKGPCNANAQ